MVNILIVGNGFDMAHGLHTSYDHCLNFLKAAKYCLGYAKTWEDFSLQHRGLMLPETECILHQFFTETRNGANSTDHLLSLLKECISDNFWLEHFLKCTYQNSRVGKTWVDFEQEISAVVKKLSYMEIKSREHQKKFGLIDTAIFTTAYDLYFDCLFSIAKKQVTARDDHAAPSEAHLDKLNKILLSDLNRFTTAVEIYLKICTKNNKVSENLRLPEIDGIGKIDAVISFNYTDTFVRYLGSEVERSSMCFIHGKIRGTIENMDSPLVLGIDEYLSDEDRNRDVDFVGFKKYFQRLQKECDFNYKHWFNDRNVIDLSLPMKNAIFEQREKPKYNLFFFGHSLDITDKDILKELICANNTCSHIFYRSNDSRNKSLKNLIRVIGGDELNSRMRSTSPTIVFEKQSDF